MKLIDADKLKAKLKRQKHELELSIQSQGNDYGQSSQIVAYVDVLSIVESLCKECVPVGSGWVARDKDNHLHYFKVKPIRLETSWYDRDCMSMWVDGNEFSDLRWEDEPIEVDLLINKI